ncbi:MAG: hypothetical protein PHX83_12120 [Acidobacteriia bacterium]|nr:hypothetical protein [Terriglobia bacterium]
MKFVNQTRRKFIFDVTNIPDFELDGIRCKDGRIEFPRVHKDNSGRKTFEAIDDCSEWFEDFEAKREALHSKSFLGLSAKAAEVTDAEWEAVKKQMVDPAQFQKSDVRVYHPFLANNFIDRDGERFPVKTLWAFAKTIVGKSLLPKGHDWGPPGNGRFYAADVKKVSVEETLALVGDGSDKLRSQLAEIEKRDGGVYWLVPSFFVLASDQEFVRKMDAGIIKDMSIGFRGFSEPVKDENGNVLWVEWVGQGGFEPEAVEASFVFLGSQLGARNAKSAKDPDEITKEDAIKPFENEHACRVNSPDQYERFARKNCEQKHEGKCIDVIYGIKDGKTEIQALRYPKSVWDVDDARKHCADRGGSFETASGKSADSAPEPEPANSPKQGGSMKIEVKSLAVEKELELTEDAVKAFFAEINEQIEEIQESAEEAVKALDEKTNSMADLEARAKLGDEYKSELIKEAIKYGVLAGLFQTDKTEAKTKLFGKLEVEDIKALRDEYFSAYTEKHPPASKSPDNHEPKSDDKGKKKDKPTGPTKAYMSEV